MPPETQRCPSLSSTAQATALLGEAALLVTGPAVPQLTCGVLGNAHVQSSEQSESPDTGSQLGRDKHPASWGQLPDTVNKCALRGLSALFSRFFWVIRCLKRPHVDCWSAMCPQGEKLWDTHEGSALRPMWPRAVRESDATELTA